MVGLLIFVCYGCKSNNPPLDLASNTVSTTTNNNNNTPPTAKTGLIFSAITSTAGGAFAPRHVVVIWVEDSIGNFVKTLTLNAKIRSYDLTNWYNASKNNTEDASTGATRSTHGIIYAVWNGTDSHGSVVKDGNYRICMELSDKDDTGNFSYFNFTKANISETLTPPDVPSFSSISIKWIPLSL